MLQNSAPQDKPKIRAQLLELVVDKRISSIQTISSMLELDYDVTLDMLSDLVSEGVLEGTIDESNGRFYSRNVEVSDAPVVPKPEDVGTEAPKSSMGKYGVLSGIALIIVGELIPAELLSLVMLEDIKIGFIFLGMAAFLGGLFYLSRPDPPV
ncbi:MAG: hypothetical protein ACW99U_09225 [Candidatus Thorarchaeota archaeon]|jgi:hypothetical protein